MTVTAKPAKPFWQARRDARLARRKPVVNDRLSESGLEINNAPPLVANIYLPSTEQRIAMYEAAGQLRQDQLHHLYSEDVDFNNPYGSDDFDDHEDDIPNLGISPYEDHPVKALAAEARKARKDAATASKAKPATPLPGDGSEPLKTSAEPSPEPLKKA